MIIVRCIFIINLVCVSCNLIKFDLLANTLGFFILLGIEFLENAPDFILKMNPNSGPSNPPFNPYNNSLNVSDLPANNINAGSIHNALPQELSPPLQNLMNTILSNSPEMPRSDTGDKWVWMPSIRS